MATHTDIHDTTDARVTFTKTERNLSNRLDLATRNQDSVTFYLPRDPKARLALCKRLRLALDSAEEDALGEIVKDNLDSMTDEEVHRCTRCGHDRDDHEYIAGRSYMGAGGHPCNAKTPFQNGAPGIRNCTCWDFTRQRGVDGFIATIGAATNMP